MSSPEDLRIALVSWTNRPTTAGVAADPRSTDAGQVTDAAPSHSGGSTTPDKDASIDSTQAPLDAQRAYDRELGWTSACRDRVSTSLDGHGNWHIETRDLTPAPRRHPVSEKYRPFKVTAMGAEAGRRQERRTLVQSESVAVDSLLLDDDNPRLPPALVGQPQPEIVAWLQAQENLEELAVSMLDNGFFPHEPLIVLPPSSSGERVVLEGNRRLAALTVLLQLPAAVEADVEFDLEQPPTGEQLDRLRQVPVFEVPDRDAVRKFLGFRHIGGLRTWSPEAKARYLTEEVDRALAAGSPNAFRDVGRRVGSNTAGVRGPFLALALLRTAQSNFDIKTAYVMRNRFGVWNRLMNSGDVRAYINLQSIGTAEEVLASVQRVDGARLAEVIGDLTPAEGRKRSVLNDSRDVTIYAAVLTNNRAHETLRAHDDLDLARQIVERASLAGKIRSIAQSTELVVRELTDDDATTEVFEAATLLLGNARTLQAAVKTRLEDDEL